MRYSLNMSIQPIGVIPEFTMGDRLRKARELTGLDQGPFADELDVSRATISNAERGVRRPQRIVLKAWSLRTGVPVEWLETGNAPDGGERARRDSNPKPSDP